MSEEKIKQPEISIEQQLIIRVLGELQWENIMKAAQMEKARIEIEKLKKEADK